MADTDGTINLPSESDTAAPEPPGPGAEPRWPMATAVLTATILYVGTPTGGACPAGGCSRSSSWSCSGS